MLCLVGLSHASQIVMKILAPKKKGLAHMGVVNYSQVADGSTHQHQLANV